MESVKDPDMDIDEKPEKVFTVADKEVIPFGRCILLFSIL